MPPPDPLEEDKIDMTPPPDPAKDDPRLDMLAQAATHAACRPGAITVYDPADRSITVVPIRCKKWQCPSCGPILATIWAKRIADAKPQRMITLTCDHGGFPDPRHAYDAMKAGLTKLTRLIRQKIGKFEYAAVWELHQDGYPHLHLATRGTYIPQKWLSRTWANLGLGPIVDVRKVTTGKAAAVYLAKYMTKTVAAGKGTLKLSRVIQASKHYFEGVLFSQKSYVPPGGKTVRCRQQPYDVIRYLIDHCAYRPDPQRPGPPWRLVPTLDEAHSGPPDDLLAKLG